jgi:hypothetical protein
LRLLYTDRRKKAGKIVHQWIICPSKAVRLRSATALCVRAGIDPIRTKGSNMGGPDKKSEPPKKGEGKSKPPPPVPPVEDDNVEDGDIATPKRDRYGDDDEPL